MPREKSKSVGARNSNLAERMSRIETVAFFERRQVAFDNLDAAALAADYTDDCIVESPSAGTIEGRAGVEKAYRVWFDAFMDMETDTEILLIDGNQVAQVIRVEGTNIGKFMGLPGSGKRFHFSAVCLFEFRGRQIERERRIYDFTGLLLQVGILKAKPF
jgi:steroid delta-isomerase-like uncharacterized protein